MSKRAKPPSSNTGAPHTAPVKNRCIIDWLGFTVPFQNIDDVFDLLGISSDHFSTNGRGGMGYKCAHRYGKITVYSDGTPEMGCHVEMTGTGCREYELDGLDWRELFTRISIKNGHLTRLDIAIDVVDGSLPLQKIESHIKRDALRMFFRAYSIHKSHRYTSDGPVSSGYTRYLGSKTSRTLFRIYDKAVEQKIENVDWVRFEIQLRDERANVAAEHIVRRDDLGAIATAIINHQISFIDLTDSNKSRCPLSPWWSNFLQTTEKLKLTKTKLVRLLDHVREHLIKQYAPTIAMLREGLGGTGFKDFMHNLITAGMERMTIKHYEIIHRSQVYCDVPF
jgi:phage replication initiation protein